MVPSDLWKRIEALFKGHLPPTTNAVVVQSGADTDFLLWRHAILVSPVAYSSFFICIIHAAKVWVVAKKNNGNYNEINTNWKGNE